MNNSKNRYDIELLMKDNSYRDVDSLDIVMMIGDDHQKYRRYVKYAGRVIGSDHRIGLSDDR